MTRTHRLSNERQRIKRALKRKHYVDGKRRVRTAYNRERRGL